MEKTQSTPRQIDNDEIDLIELIKVLWDQKLWIILSAFLSTAIAAIYAFTAKEQWTSKAEIIAPKMTDIGDYLSIRQEYVRITGGEFNADSLSNGLFARFNLLSESLDERRNFFMQSDYYSSLVEGKTEQEKRLILSDLVKDISITKPDPKKEPDLIGRRINFSAETPSQAQNVLEKFIGFIDLAAYKLELQDFLIFFNKLINDLKYEKSKFERDLNIQKRVQIDNLNNALNIAKEAGIKEYSRLTNLNDSTVAQLALSENKIPLSDSKLSDGTYLFMLGEKYLQAQIDVIAQNEVIYPPRYYQVTELLKELEPLFDRAKESSAKAFSYQASPDFPLLKDKPKKAIILALGLVIGLVISSLVVLMINIFRK
ncbi:chain length determination protein [Ursidibacter maritimus]|uniref:Chain length determination protein n=1 Tax=Ursidibacter maritimus TaxID=1331689 RepID=A0A949WN92_9PAST|nr:Wzz/FepE/Etk N-terminal domain-containing protein [Ursidibacter maritimus]KAE9540307.1 chain length determination protein [Ursidibacter maritimus]MBV6524502.1 chain length determination protein [Ursidibacter maritimus]MBV6525330.1 chain length determination protein [Ursidibacter maritimus]MBV6528001.1 chain length determination protein [Ursidibacter maritimus]MBV6529141.1 chain length determination protein [Ursidibacter maritimus]